MSETTKKQLTGVYYTPIDLATKEIEKTKSILNTDFSDYKIWDMAAGTGNLIKSLNFQDYSNCYISTLEQEDIDEMYTDNLFPRSTKFQFDFLNDYESDLPKNLLNDLKDNNNKWLFTLNPPYAGSSGGTTGKGPKPGNSNTLYKYKISKDPNIKSKKTSNDLFSQFIYRICDLTTNYNLNLSILLICKHTGILTKPNFKDIYNLVTNNFHIYPVVSSYNSYLFGTNGHFDINASLWTSEKIKGVNYGIIENNIYDNSYKKIKRFKMDLNTTRIYLSDWKKQLQSNKPKVVSPPLESNGLEIKK